MENMTMRLNVKNYVEKQDFIKQAWNLRSTRFTVFHDDFFACHLRKENIKFEKLSYLRFFVTDISKYWMYGFFYDKLRRFDPTLLPCYVNADSYLPRLQ